MLTFYNIDTCANAKTNSLLKLVALQVRANDGDAHILHHYRYNIIDQKDTLFISNSKEIWNSSI